MHKNRSWWSIHLKFNFLFWKHKKNKEKKSCFGSKWNISWTKWINTFSHLNEENNSQFLLSVSRKMQRWEIPFIFVTAKKNSYTFSIGMHYFLNELKCGIHIHELRKNELSFSVQKLKYKFQFFLYYIIFQL